MRMIPAAAVAALALVLTGCGDTEDAADEPKVVEIDMADVLLNQDDLADDFVEGEADDESDEPDMGCFSDADSLGEKAEEKEEATYVISNELEIPEVELTVSRFKSVSYLEESFEAMVESIDDCDSFEAEDDGLSLAMEVDSDDDVTLDDVDGQVTIDVTGTMTTQGQEIPMHVFLRGAHVNGYFTGVMVVDMGDLDGRNPGAMADVLLEAQAERLVAVIEGDDLPEHEDLALGDAYTS